jgi:DNA/RNA endonuclease G (NUC1)
MDDLSISQRSAPQGEGWWSWEVWLDGPDTALDKVEAVVYTLHPTFPDPRRRVTDRASRFSLRAGGWGEFMIRADVNLRDGQSLTLQHWLRLQEITAGAGRALFLTGAKEDKSFTDDVQDRLEKHGFTVLRDSTPAAFSQATVAIAVLSSTPSPWFDGDLEAIRGAHLPLLIVALQTFEIPACLAAYRSLVSSGVSSGISSGNSAEPVVAWLLQVLDRPQLPLDHGALPSVASAFWNRRLALASVDLQRAAQSVFPLVAGGRLYATAVAISQNLVIAPLEGELPTGLMLRLPTGYLPVTEVSPSKGFSIFRVPVELSTYLPLGYGNPSSALVATLSVDIDENVTLSPGWLTRGVQPYELTHDAASATVGAAVISLESGALLGIDKSPGMAFPVSLVRDLLPPDAISVGGTGLESAQSTDDDFLEKAKAKPEDYAKRNGYDADFLDIPVPLPATDKKIDLLAYENFSVALAVERRLTLYACVNINGRRLVQKNRAGDPWQYDPRVPQDEQVGGKYYSGTPLDRGHMVRRVDPVWGKNADLAEQDTFHYPNSCPQHKNLNRKIWNDLEDYIYDNLKREDLKVTVFTGPVLAGDDAVFHGLQLPKEFWKVVVMVRDDGQLSATAYLLSQEDMIEGLEFVYGEFRTYQVAVALIEKKTGLNFGTLRAHDPRARKGALEAVENAVAEIRGPQDLDLDFGAAVANAAVAPAAIEDAWQDMAGGESRLSAALNTFDWSSVDQITRDLMAALAKNPDRFDEPFARRILYRLQRKRRFNAMLRVGDALLSQGLGGHQIKRRYAQALIDQGFFYAAETVLRAMIADTLLPPAEQEEAQGLLGRSYKQIYVNANAPSNPKNIARLQNAVDCYSLTYVLNPANNFWHGINVVACLHRAEIDGIKLQSPADPQKVASDILKDLEAREQQSATGELSAFELSTLLEAHLGLGQFAEAIARAKMYAESKDADAFEIASTLRQMEEVWKLRDNQPPGDSILSILRAALLAREGGSLQLSASVIRTNLEKVFGADKSVSLKWYEDGLERAKSIARIETNDKGFGTGWLVNAADFSLGQGLLLVTNAHVIGPDTSDRYPGSLRPEDATIHFQIQDWKLPAGKVVFHSPVNEHDATFLTLPNLPTGAAALPLDATVLKVENPPQRLYIIGHPGGRDLEFSLQDNHLLAATEQLVHYRTPSEGGSSGSPVFGPTDWKVVALHHAGRQDMPRIDGQAGTYEANEGIALKALQVAISSGASPRLATR